MADDIGVCEGCASYKKFGDQCFFFWKHKKTCTHFRENEFAPEDFKSIQWFL